MNIIIVFGLYLSLYLVLLVTGYPIARRLFREKQELAGLIAPIISFCILSLVGTAVMYHQSGMISGIIAILGVATIAAFCAYSIEFSKSQYVILLRQHFLGFLAGIIFLSPLLLSNDIGIFALNGADFGSYAGWGSYFRNHTLLDGRPSIEPINSTLAGFANLQEELVKLDGRWRVGNISVFAALNSLVPTLLWPGFYMVFIGFLVGQFSLAIQGFCRYTLLQPRSVARQVAWLSIFLNTIFWLASSHYTPNIIGLVLTLWAISLLISPQLPLNRMAVIFAIILSNLILIYPESYLFIPVILIFQLLIRDGLALFKKQRSRARDLIFTLSISFSLVWIFTIESFPLVVRHLLSITGYSRPGDFVGIHHWSYISQGLGFADYNSMLRQYNFISTRILVLIGYGASFLLFFIGLYFCKTDKSRYFERSRNKSLFALLGAIILFCVPIAYYLIGNQLLLAWRALLTLSPYIWMVLSILGVQSFACTPNLLRNRRLSLPLISATSFVVILGVAIFFRIGMLQSIIGGSDHAAIFGTAFQEPIQQLARKKYDIVFIEYEGSGTIQGGWEFYAQYLPFIFPEHGSGRNEYSIDPLKNKSIAVINGNFKKVHHLIGFNEALNNKFISISDEDNILIPYSSTWIYFKGDAPKLVLPGLPGKFLFWSVDKVHACLELSVHANRPGAYLRLTIDKKSSSIHQVNENVPIKVCDIFNKGLNSFRFEPLFIDKEIHKSQQKMVAEINNENISERDVGILNIYSLGFPEKNPLYSSRSSDWGRKWNLITPEDIYPLNPHLIFDSIALRKID
jgi:hypothetical protein